jgi:phenylacetate-CoA ligase
MTGLALRAACILLAPLHHILHSSGACSSILALRGLESARWLVGRLGVWIRYFSTLQQVPAYRAFVAARVSHGTAGPALMSGIPETDKQSYVCAYALDSRCTGGRLPANGVLFDESSGTTGQPTHWVRGKRERAANGRMLRLAVRRRFGAGPLMFINTFALGPWATGVNLTLTLSQWGRLKVLGPDKDKVINALRSFGTGHHYVILGYPPFLKQLFDSADIDWSQYQVSLIFGGEGMSESMRRYLQQRGATRVIGSYGASDLEINIAAETDLTQALRRLLEARPDVAARVLQHGGASPMIFQFNPAEFFIESNAGGELLVTICRPHYVAPKVRYNIHDVGHVMRFPELQRLLAEAGIDTDDLDPHALDLPLLFHYGRSDLGVAYFGCKLSPADVQEALFRLPQLATAVDDFKLGTFEDETGDKCLVVDMAQLPGSPAESPLLWQTGFFDELARINQDFRESRRIAPPGKPPRLVFHAAGQGPFAASDLRTKRSYVRASA